MKCTDPRTVGFQSDGKTICWSPKLYSKEYAPFQLPCGQCLSCRLDFARSWAIRCVHEAQMYENNCFITLTYDDDHLGDGRLHYRDFQLFMKRLRKRIFTDFLKSFGEENWKLLSKEERKVHYDRIAIGCFVTGEYGDLKKRPHWHACVFNWCPFDAIYKYSNHRGDKSYSSEILQSLWGSGTAEFGSLTFESAGYCARYAAKKLVHGNDGHQFEPISKRSCRQAIGKKWIERFWPDVFNYGSLILASGATSSIPRYYEKWLQKHHPDAWIVYVTQTKQGKIDEAIKRSAEEALKENAVNAERKLRDPFARHVASRRAAAKAIQDQKFKSLQENLKL